MDLTQGIIQYLEKELEAINQQTAPSNEEVKSRQKIIDYFQESKGQCLGLSTLWSYGRRVADEVQEDEQKPKDDIHSFHRIEHLLTQWDGETSLPQQDKADIERFISNVLLYQRFDLELLKKTGSFKELIFHDDMQFNLPKLMEDTKRGAPINSYHSEGACLTKDMLQNRLKDLIRPKSMIFLSTTQGKAKGGHVVSVYQNESDNKIHFFNSNQKHEIVIDNLSQLTELLWNAFDPASFQTGFSRTDASDIAFRNIAADIVKFEDDPHYSYLTSEQFIATPVELAAYFKDPDALGFKGSKTNAFIDSIEPDQLYRILKDKDVNNKTQKSLLQRCVAINKIPPCLAHFIKNRYAELLDELIKENRITPEKLTAFTEKPPIRENSASLEQNKFSMDTFLQMYHYDEIDEDDLKTLDIYDVLCIMSHIQPHQTELFDKLITHCKKEVPTLNSAQTHRDLANNLCAIVGKNQWEASDKYYGRTRSANPKYIEIQKQRMEVFLEKLHQDFHLPLPLNHVETKGTEGSFSQVHVVPLILNAFEPVLQQKDAIAKEFEAVEASVSAKKECFREVELDEKVEDSLTQSESKKQEHQAQKSQSNDSQKQTQKSISRVQKFKNQVKKLKHAFNIGVDNKKSTSPPNKTPRR